MMLKVVTQDLCRPVHLSVLGVEMELDGLPFGMELCITEGEDDSVAVSLADPMEEALIDAVQPEEELIEDDIPEEAQQPYIISVRHDEELLNELKELRKVISSEQSIPPYCVFNDKVLHEIVRVMPEDMKDISGISGIGKVKLESYGLRFLEAVRRYREGMVA